MTNSAELAFEWGRAFLFNVLLNALRLHALSVHGYGRPIAMR